jgi:hypothetical protein
MSKRLIWAIILIFIILMTLLECRSYLTNDGELNKENTVEDQYEDGFEDGTYCAEVDYYNPNTGTRSDYTLEVEVENNEVVRISFGNGGWLDSEHITPQELDENGECTITSDRNYEYGIKIIGQDCGYTDDIEEEQDPETRYTVSQCASIYNMTQQELKACLKALNIEPDELLPEETCENLGDYLKIYRASEALEKEMNEGYIQGVYHYQMQNIVYCHQVMVLKYGTYYWLEVRGSEKCSTGTMKFNENNSGWQTVPVKYSPDNTTYSVYQMRMIGKGSSKLELDKRIREYCNRQFQFYE